MSFYSRLMKWGFPQEMREKMFHDYSNMNIFNDKFSTFVVAVMEGHVVWYNLYKILLIKNTTDHTQVLSVLMGMFLGIKVTPITFIHAL